ncbi:MAG: ABC transporter permease [Ruminococcus sp.]|nr:ABC transporter permease [Candidatus Apopatosoma intestinale]
MKKTQKKELFINIKTTFVSFFSIMMFVCLSIAIYTGMIWASNGAEKGCDDLIVQTNFHDAEVLSAYGFSDEDVAAFGNQGIETEGVYTSYEFFQLNGVKYHTAIYNLPKSIDMLIGVEGFLPEKENQIGVDAAFADENNIKIGDTIVFEQNNSPLVKVNQILKFDLDEDDMTSLNTVNDEPFIKEREFVVTALIKSPKYLSKDKQCYGISSVTQKNVNTFMYVNDNAFNLNAFCGYSGILISNHHLDAYRFSSDEYSNGLSAYLEELKIAVDRITEEKNQILRDKIDAIKKKANDTILLSEQKLEEMQLVFDGNLLAQGKNQGNAEDNVFGSALNNAIETLNSNKQALEVFTKETDDIKEAASGILNIKQNVGFLICSTLKQMFKKLSGSMASLFVIVGLLVCYSSLSRIVNSQTKEIGTKKALGLSTKEITKSYLAYAALAAITGCFLGVLLGYYVVEFLFLGALKVNFNSDFRLYFSYKDVLAISLPEILLLLITTYLACRKNLKRKAISLLQGETKVHAKIRFYEKTKLWARLPLLKKTIVNNFFNDSRRVLGTVIGIVGSTALIVTALTFNNNYMNSFKYQYDNVFGFDRMVYFDDTTNAAAEIQNLLDKNHIRNTKVYNTQYTVKGNDDVYTISHIYVYEDTESFKDLVNIIPYKSNKKPDYDGVWMCSSYSNFYNLDSGASVLIYDLSGNQSELPVAGFFRHYLINHTTIMSKDVYQEIFGNEAKSNCYLIDSSNTDIGELTNELTKIDGFDFLRDYYTESESSFGVFANIAKTIVAVYTVLSILIDLLVLLNLLTMFVMEKKKEIITLLINGYRLKDAKKYIYSDTVLLTVIGIIIGTLIGTIVGNSSIEAMASRNSMALTGINFWACFIGSLGSMAMTFLVSVISLKKINKFKLTDINKAG